MTEEELLYKFDSMVLEQVTRQQRDRMVEAIMSLEKFTDVRNFMKLMVK